MWPNFGCDLTTEDKTQTWYYRLPQAIRCAEALRVEGETLGIEIRAGIHTGECELLDTDIGGLAVHIAARILGHAGAGDIIVSRTLRDLVVRSGTGFEDRGSVELRGVPGAWELLAVDRHGAPAGSPEAQLVSHPLPPLGPRRRHVGSADTVDSARDGPPRPADRPQLKVTPALPPRAPAQWPGRGSRGTTRTARAAYRPEIESAYIPMALE
jgi:hypothetical protein